MSERTEQRPYRPSNGTEGTIFEDRFCCQCSKQDVCEIMQYAWLHDIGDPEYPAEWIYGPGGVPQCTAFEKGGVE